MKPTLWIFPVAAMAAMGGCVVVDGPSETRTFANTGFDRINASSGIDVVLSQGPFAVSARAPEGKLDRIEIEQTGSELNLKRRSEWSWFGSTGRYVVNVTAPAITAINASGGADVEVRALQGESLALDASGGADIDLASLQVATLSISTSGGGDIELSGTCQSARINASGGGDVNGERLSCGDVTADASGGGDIDVQASLSATGNASSGGDIRFIGSPAKVTEQESSGGDVSVEAR
jgi:hypothetical protein